MKKINLILVLLILILPKVLSQVPQMFNYQATLRDNTGQVLISAEVSLKISIIQNNASGTTVYSETHSVTTTSQGIINLRVGSGSSTDVFEDINWNTGPYFMKVELDAEGGNNYLTIGTSEFSSVPFALNAKEAGMVEWNNVQNKPYIFSGDYYDLNNLPLIPNNTNQLINGAGFLTSLNESDPLFMGSPSKNITAVNISEWKTSFIWGNHALAGYSKYPSMTNNQGRFLSTDGSSATWKYAVNAANAPLSILQNGISISKASATSDGYLSSNDWNLFNNKAPSPWMKNDNNIFYTDGKVGIGTYQPQNALSIEGNEDEWPGRIMLSLKNKSTGPKSLAYLKIYSGIGEAGTSLGHVSTTYAANESPEDVAGFGILASSDKGMIISATKSDLSPGIIKFFNGQTAGTKFIETMRINGNGHVGIGTQNPDRKLHVESYVQDGEIRDLVFIRNLSSSNTAYTGLNLRSDDYNYGLGISFSSSNYNLIPDFHQVASMMTNGRAFAISCSSPEGSIRLFTNTDGNGIIERMRISSTGYVGFGTKNPKAKVEVADGDVYISSIDKGIIMTSPDGQCWRGTINNSGVLEFSVVECPF
jgi:hypothetical protein